MSHEVLWPFCDTWAMLQVNQVEGYIQLCTSTEKKDYRKINQGEHERFVWGIPPGSAKTWLKRDWL